MTFICKVSGFLAILVPLFYKHKSDNTILTVGLRPYFLKNMNVTYKRPLVYLKIMKPLLLTMRIIFHDHAWFGDT